jgi:hypothetical protein
MERNTNPYTPPTVSDQQVPSETMSTKHRGPLLYFAISGIFGAALAIPLLTPRSLAVEDDPNPIGYLLILISFPVGGLAYRLRSRRWAIDETVRPRQRRACWATLLLPLTAAIFTGMRAQGLHITILCLIVSLTLIAGILVSGQRRGQNMA